MQQPLDYRTSSFSLARSPSDQDFYGGGYPSSSYNDFNNLQKSASTNLLAQDVVEPPKLGEDWGAAEGKRERYAKRNQRKSNVGGWFVRRKKATVEGLGELRRSHWILWGGFAFIVALGLTLYFVIPRSPAVQFDQLWSTDTNPTRSSVDATFDFKANVSFLLDARGSYIPVHMNDLTVTISDLATDETVGTGRLSRTIPGRTITNVTVPVTFYAQFGNSSSTTYQDIVSACAPIYTNVERPSLSLSFVVTLKIAGIIGSTSTRTQSDSLTCPITFPSSST